MEKFDAGDYDVIVIGAGHAGCEAALASARMGLRTIIFTINLDSIAMLPCNPSIGGTGKGHLVKEIDALGGEMGINIDKSMIQCKVLNTAKGPAVHSLRAQADKALYHQEMKKTLERTENLWVKQSEIIGLIIENDTVKGVETCTGGIYKSKAVILATGTYLNGKVFIGHSTYESGPNGLASSKQLTQNLKENKLDLRRFKTGTPARINARSLKYENMIEQPGDSEIMPFSFMTDEIKMDQISCWLTYTNQKTHEIIKTNIFKSAMYGGKIEGTGPRYCPSIEDKITRFADKERHQLFLEPEGLNTNEVYVQGMSTSLPEDVQEAFMRTIPGLENVEILRPAYAIEYDCVNPLQLKPTLESKIIENVYCAGQFNGSSGYEEAAAQGLIAGINAACKVLNREPLILDRSQAYIGVLIDDLVTKGTNEPYRIMTSRCEYRLLLRQDNADQRLTEIGNEIGLVKEDRYRRLLNKIEKVNQEKERIKKIKIKIAVANPILESIGSSLIKESTTLEELLKRPEIGYEILKKMDPNSANLPKDILMQVETEVKYEGYIRKQVQEVEKFKAMEKRIIAKDIDYSEIKNLRLEARQKLQNIKPINIGQASRISGVSPADVSVLMVFMEQRKRREE